jgi:esterase/lipase
MHDSNIIFLHGWLFDRRIWCHLDKFFKNNFNIQMLDLPGYGSNKLLNISPQKYCDSIFERAEKNTVIVGYSYGGLLALNSFQNYQQNIKKLILINCNLDIEDQGNKILNLRNIAALQTSLTVDKKESLKKFMYECVKNSKYYKTEFSHLIETFTDNSLPNTSTLLENLDALKASVSINCGFDRQKDILLINTEKDDFMNNKETYTINDNLIKEEIIPGLGHIPFISGNNQIYNLIRIFINN